MKRDYELLSAEAHAAEAPRTFPIPLRRAREALRVGDSAKLLFQFSDIVERMWVLIKSRTEGTFEGVLGNVPTTDTAAIAKGAAVAFRPEHVIATSTPDLDLLEELEGREFKRLVERERKNSVGCASCGQQHELTEHDALAFPSPDAWRAATALERGRSKLDRQLCMLRFDDEDAAYVRSALLVPVRGRKDPLALGIWVDVDGLTFRHILDFYGGERPRKEEFDANLANEVPGFPGSHDAECRLRLGVRSHWPELTLDPNAEHSAAALQREGVDETQVRAWYGALSALCP